MRKIPCVFERDSTDLRHVTEIVNPLCQWVINGEGVATRKWDGTACRVFEGRLYRRYDAKKGKTPPSNFEPCQEPDLITGHWPGWIPVGDGPQDQWYRAAWDAAKPMRSGTYELCGPHFQSNPEKFCTDVLIPHGDQCFSDVTRTFEGLRQFLDLHRPLIEGLVFHHPDGRMAKIRRVDFGLSWGKKEGLNG